MMNRVVRASDLIRVPWKNGGGTTAEVAVDAEGADFDTFGWRISMADVASDGPFSSFPGIDRTLILIEGAGLDLDVDGQPYRLDRTAPKLSFPGDARTVGTLVSGPIRDLNVMTRRARFGHRARIMPAGIALLAEGTCAAVVIAMDAPLDVTLGEVRHSLQPFDSLVLGPTQDMIQVSGAGRAILVEVAPGLAARETCLCP